VPREWVHKVVRKVQATNELYHWLSGSVDTPEKFRAKRPALARQVWASMEATDSRECRNCHGIDFMVPGAQATTAGKMHELAQRWGKTCIVCHKGIAHSLPDGFDSGAAQDLLHERMEKEKIDCRQCHKGMARPPSGQGWD
jgi:cytochrome c-type protein NapC